jgi:signal transduction histidine kinase
MPLYGNPDMLSKAIINLLDNAVYAVVKKAQKNHGDQLSDPVIRLTAIVADEKYILKIHDNGVGIEEKNLTKVYDPFFTTKPTGEAAGVGLYLSREIIQNHGGDISVVSVQGEYTEVTVTLPKVKGEKLKVNNEK